MTDVVYILGAGFNCSVLDPAMGGEAPLARNFFNVFLNSSHAMWLDSRGMRPIFEDLLAEIKRYWKLDLNHLTSGPFDIEECLTLFESQLADTSSRDRLDVLSRCVQAIASMLVAYLGDLSLRRIPTPSAQHFGSEVTNSKADVLTFNYDTLAESAVESASGVVKNFDKSYIPSKFEKTELPDDKLDASHYQWNRNLAFGIQFNQVRMPVAGLAPYVSGERYYNHPANELYSNGRILKLHGSVSWFKYADQRAYPPGIDAPHSDKPPPGLVLAPGHPLWLDGIPDLNGWLIQPVIITPQLYKNYATAPFPAVWQSALESLSVCKKLVVIGYSFPATDFRTRRLFLEAFSNNSLRELIVVNPDTSVAGVIRNLTHYEGPVISCSDLPSLYGVSRSL